MSPADALPLAIWVLSAYAWLSAVVLLRAACKSPCIGALTERAVVAVVIAVFGSIYSVIVWNTEVGYIVDMGTAIVVLRLAAVMLLLVPVWWTWMFITGRLVEDE